ncbi:hypothetical protein BX616_003007 [Lobosporangium transversale]|uniref:CENP-C homolog n=1 Tax=Lobosporangium transversale TaxID=64571 RepID=A0A1Y2H0R6_9FUNG|nr:hypothetical protein BCR41DRAFT_418255 [Lobosporangium transversale]KAF9899510.1 hypothetical protein BX616_003007 [Lobosporangium transversale]ORZ28149.1 hypothetical protein BCR41DRAFT_418255 [Lobosporangium transversale]|eukprot:XP_021885834.1 hypothetical protein BCR41DRAFT_418255 [Lobosporangium transversale]
MSRNHDGGPPVRTNNFFDIGVVGRRTGITMKANVKKDADGLDNIDDFWSDDKDDNVHNGSQYQGINMMNKNGNGGSSHDNEDFSTWLGLPSPSTQRQRRQQEQHQQHYLEQDLPEELLSTPTSRRSQLVPISEGSGSRRGLSLPGGAMYHNAPDEYQSPSFHAVKKRLIFTQESSDIDPGEEDDNLAGSTFEQHALTPFLQRKSHSNSPALDRLVSASMEKNALFKINSTASSPSQTLPSAKSAATSVSAHRSNSRLQMRSIVEARRTGRSKAFDFGSELTNDGDEGIDELNDDVNWPGGYDDGEGIDVGIDDIDTPLVETTPPRPVQQKVNPLSLGAPVGYKLKANMATSKPNAQRFVQSKEEDDRIHHGRADRDEDDDRLRFSDEDVYDEENEEGNGYHEILINKHREIRDPMPRRQIVNTSNSKMTDQSSKAAAASASAKKSKLASKKAKTTSGGSDLAEASADENKENGRVRSSSTQRAKSKSNSRSNNIESSTETYSRRSKITKDGSSSASQNKTQSGPPHMTPVELVEVPVVPDVTTEEQGVRRSHRVKIAPLKFWQNERVVVCRDKDMPTPIIKSVIRAENPVSAIPGLKSQKRKRQGTAAVDSSKGHPAPDKLAYRQSQKQAREIDDNEDEIEGSASELEEYDGEHALQGSRGLLGLKDEVSSMQAEVLVFGTDEKTSRVIAESKNALRFRSVESGQYLFHRGLEDTDSLASGTIKIKRNGIKPVSSATKNATTIFYVIKGIVQVTVHETEFVVSTGGHFIVPRGNQYGIRNRSKKESLLFFVQSKAPPSLNTIDSLYKKPLSIRNEVVEPELGT